MAPSKAHMDKKQTTKGYPLPSTCSVSCLQEFLTDGNASFLRAARAGNVEKIIEHLKGNIDINTSNAMPIDADFVILSCGQRARWGLNLCTASKEGNVNVVTELLKRGANVNAATKKGNTALHIASLAGQEEVVKVLVQAGANVNAQSQNGFTPLYMAAQENHDSVVSFLLANGANQSLATEDGFTPLAVALQQGHDKVVAVLLENDTKGRVRLPALHIAAKKDDCKAATLLLQSDHNPDVTSKSGFTPLHIAAHYGNENIAKILLNKGADVNYAAKHQITPLHVASKWGKMNMVVLLLENGANIEAATRDGLTPLHCAARSGHDQVVDLLLEKGAPFLAKTKNGLAPLHMASQGDHVDSARILLYHKAPVDDVTVDYLTALHVAAHCGHVKVAKLLLDRKADPNARALNGFTPLHIACKKNRIKVVELLLKHGASIEATTESGLTPLHVASFMGCMNIVIYLIQNGANPDVPTVRGETPLHLAARANQTDIIRILLRNGASVDARAREEQTPLHIAARLGNVDIVSLLLQHGAAVDATTKDMYTALHIAAKEDQEEVAACLLDHGASLTSTTKKGFTPLHLAAKYGNIKVARLLIQKDAPVDAQGKNGVTPLHVASHYDHVNVALLLLDKGASPHATAKNGYTPLHIAAKKNQMDIASTLLEYGAKTNSESKAGFTPLHLASQEGHADMASLLIENKADVNHKANNGLTPLHLCAQDDRVNVAHILVAHKAEIDPQTKAGYTPLHVASHFGQVNMVRFLLQNHADVKITTSHGYTPLHQAAQQGHTLVVNLLLENQASPNVTTTQGQTPLSIAQRLGYISVVETLKVVTETTITTTTTTVTEEKYKVVAPETMQETFMTDSEDEGGADFDEAAIFGKPTHATHVYLPYLEGQNFQMTPMVEEDKLSPQHVTPVETGFSEKFSPDNIDLGRAPVHAGRFSWTDDFYYSSLPKGMLRSRFLVSFMVDARGGAMRGCRHSGVRIIIPPRKASMPMRITCRYLRKEKLIHPPPLMEGEACASRILEMGPVGARFLGPVIIEVPHFASTRGKEREITILRSDTGESWREHVLEASEEAVQEVLNESFEGEELSALEDLNTNRITRILTTDFPQYFAIITRIRQEVHGVGPEGGMVSSTVVPQVQAIFPEGALTKKIRVGLQAQPIAPELVAKLLGNRVAVSPIVTVEPRRRKFHKPITLTIPVPQAATKGMINQYSGDAPTLRLLCSITGGSSKAQWEDVTGSTPLTFVNDCVSFTTTVSARFWLMDCRQVNEVTRFATELYQEAVYVPFMSKFVIFAKRHDPYEAQLRVFCMTDDKEDKTLECQEHFTEIAKSRDVEVLEGKLQYLEFAGNIAPVTKSGEQLKFPFQAFHENRLPFIVRVKDPHIEPMGRIAFMREPKAARGEPPQVPICNLNVALPEITLADSSDVIELVTLEKRYDFIQEAGLSKPELIHRADLRLSDIAQGLDKDWVLLAQQLDVSENDIAQIKADTTCDQSEQALMMLRLWLQKSGSKATGNELEKGLRKINREDIIKNCMFNVELVTDDVEKAVAKVHLDQSGFDVFKEELGSSRDASMRRGASLDISYDEQDIMKEAESAAETSSETGSLFERDQISQALTDDKELVSQMDDPLKCSSASNDDVADLFPKCKKSSVQQSEKTFDNHLNGRKEVSAPFDISESEGNAVRNKVETNSVVLETQNYAKQHEFWPSVPVTTSNGAFIHPADSNNFENNKEISMQKGILANDEEILNIKNLSLSENGNKSPLNDKNAENYKSNDACDFGYCSMDKVTCVSPTYISENVPPASKNHSESTSTGIPLDRARTELTSELQLLEKENFFQKQPPVGDPAKNVSLEREASTQNITGADVCQSAVESTKTLTVGNVCAAVGDSAMDVDPKMTGTTLHSENRSSENSDSKDAKIRRASKTPPPSPVDETAGDNDNVDRVKEILLIQSTFETKFKEDLKGPVEVEQKLADISGRQEIQARLTESETWPSLELDTSQVSISSLPEDEKSEPTTATVSDAVALAGDTDENVESTDDKEPDEDLDDEALSPIKFKDLCSKKVSPTKSVFETKIMFTPKLATSGSSEKILSLQELPLSPVKEVAEIETKEMCTSPRSEKLETVKPSQLISTRKGPSGIEKEGNDYLVQTYDAPSMEEPEPQPDNYVSKSTEMSPNTTFGLKKTKEADVSKNDKPVIPTTKVSAGTQSSPSVSSPSKSSIEEKKSIISETSPKSIIIVEKSLEENLIKVEKSTSPFSDIMLDTGIGTESPVTADTASSPFLPDVQSPSSVSFQSSAANMVKEHCSTQTIHVEMLSAHTSPIDGPFSLQDSNLSFCPTESSLKSDSLDDLSKTLGTPSSDNVEPEAVLEIIHSQQEFHRASVKDFLQEHVSEGGAASETEDLPHEVTEDESSALNKILVMESFRNVFATEPPFSIVSSRKLLRKDADRKKKRKMGPEILAEERLLTLHDQLLSEESALESSTDSGVDLKETTHYSNIADSFDAPSSKDDVDGLSKMDNVSEDLVGIEGKLPEIESQILTKTSEYDESEMNAIYAQDVLEPSVETTYMSSDVVVGKSDFEVYGVDIVEEICVKTNAIISSGGDKLKRSDKVISGGSSSDMKCSTTTSDFLEKVEQQLVNKTSVQTFLSPTAEIDSIYAQQIFSCLPKDDSPPHSSFDPKSLVLASKPVKEDTIIPRTASFESTALETVSKQETRKHSAIFKEVTRIVTLPGEPLTHFSLDGGTKDHGFLEFKSIPTNSAVEETPHSTQVIQTTTVMTVCSPDLQPVDEAAGLLTESAGSPHSPELSFAEKRDFFQKLSLSSSSNATPTHTLKASADEKIETLTADEVFAPDSPEEQLSFKECLKFFEKSAEDNAPKPEIKDIKKEVWTVVGDGTEDQRLDSMSDISDIEREREMEVVEIVEKRRSTVSIDEQVSLPLHENKEVSETVFDSTKDAKVEVVVKTFVPGSEMLEICSVENIPQPGEETLLKETIIETRVLNEVKKVTEIPVEESGSKPIPDSAEGMSETVAAMPSTSDDGTLPSNEEFINKTFKTFTETSFEVSRATIGAFKKDVIEKADNKWQRESPDNISIVKDKMEPSLGKSEIFICTEETLDNVKKILSVADAESNVVVHENEPSTSAAVDQCEVSIEKVIYVQKAESEFAESESKQIKDIVDSITTTTRDFSEIKPKVIELSEEEIRAVEKSIAESSVDIKSKVVQLTEEEIQAVEESIEKDSGDFSGVKSEIIELSEKKLQAVEDSVEKTSEEFAKMKSKVTHRTEKEIRDSQESDAKASDDVIDVKFKVMDDSDEPLRDVVEDADKFEETALKLSEESEKEIKTVEKSFGKLSTDFTELKTQFIEESLRHSADVKDSVERTSDYSEIKSEIIERFEKHVKDIEDITAAEEFTEIKSEFLEQSETYDKDVNESIEKSSSTFAEIKSKIDEKSEKHVKESVEKPISDFSEIKSKIVKKTEGLADDDEESLGKGSYKFVEVKSKMEEQSEKYVKTEEESAEKLTSDFTEIKSKFVEQPENTIEDVEESIEKIEIDFPEIKSKISKLSKEHMNVEESIKKTSNDFSEIESKIVDQSENLIEKVGKSVEEMSVDCSELISRLTERSEKHMELFEKVSREATDLKTESTEKSEKKIEIVTEPVEKMTNDFTKVKSELIKESVEKIERLEETHEEKSDFSEIKSKLIDKSDEAIKDAEQIKFHDKDIKADSVIEISPESSVISEKIEQGEENFESTFQKATKSLKTEKKESNIFEKVTEKESAVEVPSEIGDQMIPCEVSTSEVSVKEIFSEQTEVSIGADSSKSSISRPGQIEFQLATTLDDRNAEQEHEKDIEILKAKIQKEREMGLQFDENIAQSIGSTEEKSDSCFSSLKDQSVEIEFLPVLEVSEDIMKVSVDRTGHEALGTPCSFHKEMDLEDKNLESEGNLEDVEREKIISEFRMEKESPSAAGPSSVEKAEYEEVEKKEEATLEEMIYKKSRLCEKSSKEMVQSVEVTQFTEHSTEIYNVSSEKLIEKFSSKKIHIESSADGKDKAPHKLDKFLDSVTQQVLLPSDVTPVHKRTEEWLDQSGEMMLREVEPLDSAENGLFEDRPPTLEDEAHKRSSPTAESFDDKARMEQCDTDVMMQLLDFVSRNDIELSEVRTEDEAPDIEEDVSPTAEEEICSRVSCNELKIDEKISAKEKSPECLKVIESENLLLSPQRSSFDSVTSPSRRDAPSENVETVLDLRLNGRVHPQSSLEVEVGSHDSEEYLEKEVLPLSFVEEESLAQSDIKIGKMSQAEVTEGKVTAAEDKDKAAADEREAELLLEDSVVKQFQQEGAPVVDSQEVVKVASSSETPVESLHISAFREEKQPEGKTDETATEHAHPFHEKTILTEDHELIVDDNYTRSVEESSNEFIPCAFVNTAFAGADLIDKVEQGSPARARSPYEVVRGEEEESKDKAIRTTYITEMRHRPMLQNIPSEISEEDLVEREIGSPELRLDALSIPQQSDVAPIQTEQKLMPEDSLSAAESSTQKTVTSETVTYDTEAGGVTKTTVVTRIYTTTTLVHGSEREQDEGVPKSNASDSSNKLESADRSLEAAAISESEFGRIVDSREQPMMSVTDRIDSTKFVEPEQVMNGPGEVEYQPEYDYSGEYSHLKWSSEPFGEASYSGISCRDPSVSQEMKKSRYSSISDDVIDYEIGEILKSDQQFEDIIERPMTPEPPIDEYLDSGMTNASLKAKKAVKELTLSEYELKEKDDSLYDDAEPISSPALSPDDSRSGFTYGMQFEKDILDVAEEAMDIDSDPYSEEKEPMYAYGMRYEREVVLEEEDVPCYGDLYTHEEEDEDALENGDKIKPAVKPKKEPEYDMLAGRKYFSKNVEIDELSVSSLQEFEHLEAEIVSGRKSSVGSLDSLNDKPPNSKSGDHDDVSMSSLTEFERLERECLEVEKIDPAMQESITQLSEIEEGHESQASETSQEHKSDGCRDEELSIIDEYDQHLGDIDNIILNVESESKDELPFQYVLKQVPKPSDVVKCEVSEEGDKTSEVSKTTGHAAITFTSEICMQQSRDHLTKSNGKNDDIDQDSLRDEVSLKPDSLTEDPRHEFLDSLHEGKCDEDDSLQGDIPDVMRDSLLEERHLEDDSLHEMDILPDESSLSMESSFAAAISHDSSRAEDQTKGKRQDGLALSATLESGSVVSSKLDKVEIIVSELPKCDIMLSSTDSLEQSSSAAAAFHFESESAMSTSLTGALASEDNTMISSTDTLEHEGRITFRYEDIPVDDLEILVKDGRKVIVDSEGNIQTEYDVKHFLDSDDNLNDFNLSSKNFTEIKLPSTSTVHVQSALTSISYTGDTDDTKTKFQHSAADEREEQKKSESFYSDPDVEVEEIHTTDEFGNPKIIKRIKKVITTRTQYSSSSSSENVEEKLKEFLREHAAGENAGLGEEVVQEERSMDDKGNILLVRTVQQQVLSQPEVHSRTFTGPDAAALSEEYIRQFKELDPTDDVCEYEKIDDEGNVVRVTQQVVIKPEMHSVSFSGPNAREQMEEYMRRFTAASQNGDASEAQSFSTVRVSTTTEQSQEIFPSERISHDLKGAAEFIQTTIANVTPESSEQIVRTVTSTCTTASTVDDPADPRASADEHAPSS
ncbi:Ankyrin-2 like protein [Argiope bruennichi]|uniref:Ankyrin-2 like protein n=1 Tax=Argiope bruennichi TaxID=94029 RepID=A0A8T0E9X4_ARGBR|nr:Ankyrin-2 like protein [Argiope bruennichi]